MSSSPTDDEHHSSDQGGNTPSLSDLSSEQKNHLLSPKPKHAIAATANTTDKIDTSKVEKTEDHKQSPKNDEIFDEDNKGSLAIAVLTNFFRIEEEKKPTFDIRIETNGRNILDLGANLRGNGLQSPNNVWQQQGFIRYAHLPENNLKMFLENRSQYHRLGANGNLQEYALVDCKCCDFTYPVNGDTTKSSTSMGNNIIKSIKTNINGVNENPSTVTRPSTQNQYFSVDKPQFHNEPNNINFDNLTSNNVLTALNRNATNFTNQSNNNILENVAAALLNTTNNVSPSSNYGLNQKHFNNNTHHHYNNQQQQQHAFAGNYHYGTKNYYTSHSHSYKQF